MIIKKCLALLACFVLLASVSFGSTQIIPASENQEAEGIELVQGSYTPNLIPHEQRARENCLGCHQHDIDESPTHPEGFIDECMQCHVYE